MFDILCLMTKLAKTIVFIFAVIMLINLQMSFSIISSCVQGLGEDGCIGVSGLVQMLLMIPLILVLIILTIVYVVRYFGTIELRKVVAYIFLGIFLIVAPFVFTQKVSRAYLFDSTFLMFDFRNVDYAPKIDQENIKNLSDCEVFLNGAERCKTEFILKNNLGIESCDVTLGGEKYRCRYAFMEKNNYEQISAEFCYRNFFENVPVSDRVYYRNCITALANLEKNEKICELQRNMSSDVGRQNDYVNWCIRHYTDSYFLK